MYVKLYLSIAVFFWSIVSLQAQDTLLAPVEIYDQAYIKYALGTKQQSVDSTWLARNRTLNLGNLLMEQTGVYVKQYGNGMLSSLSFRGTGAGHTAVLWNGININSPTLGESDFSLLPVAATDQVTLQYGSASSLFGSDAIGGSILLNSSTPTFQKGLQTSLQQSIGSFGRWDTQAGLQWSNDRWYSNTNLYRTQLENDFFVRENGNERTINNAATHSYGLLQDIGYRLDNRNELVLNTWYHFSDRGLQNYNATQEDENLRLSLSYHHTTSQGFLRVQTAYVQDRLLYNNTSRTLTKRWISNGTYEISLAPFVTLQTGVKTDVIWTDVDNYAERYRQIRTDLFALSHWRILPRWQASLNLRQTFVSGFDAPFAPSLGTTYHLIDQPTQQLQAKATVSRSYRVPNLNAMYWEPGGNPDIRSETGTNWEGGLRYKKEYKDQLQFDVEATYYQMNVQDWILWQPISSYWSPINLREVNVQGVELQATGQWRLAPTTKLRLSGNYAYTQSTNKISESNGETIHKQLPYVPFHRLSITTGLEIKGFWLTGNTHYTDVRFTTTNNEQYIDGFVLTNLQLGKHFSYDKHAFTLSFDVNNIFDTNYRNVGNQAMPLRNYLLTFRYQFN
ncbi:MAG: TonB-dependent receptor [Thermonemataceae bacterium]